MTRPKILILGHARHGKDTFAEMLSAKCGLSFVPSSLFCAEKVMLPYFAGQGVFYNSVTECFNDRVNHRATWHQQIARYNTPDKAKLAREVLAIADMYVGMRCNQEYEASRPLFDHVVWVDASGRGLPPEPADSFNIRQRDDMYVVQNNWGLEELEDEVDTFATKALGALVMI